MNFEKTTLSNRDNVSMFDGYIKVHMEQAGTLLIMNESQITEYIFPSNKNTPQPNRLLFPMNETNASY